MSGCWTEAAFYSHFCHWPTEWPLAEYLAGTLLYKNEIAYIPFIEIEVLDDNVAWGLVCCFVGLRIPKTFCMQTGNVFCIVAMTWIMCRKISFTNIYLLKGKDPKDGRVIVIRVSMTLYLKVTLCFGCMAFFFCFFFQITYCVSVLALNLSVFWFLGMLTPWYICFSSSVNLWWFLRVQAFPKLFSVSLTTFTLKWACNTYFPLLLSPFTSASPKPLMWPFWYDRMW